MHDRATVLAALDAELSRRRLLRTGFGGVLLIAFGAVLPTGCERYSSPTRTLKFLTRKEYAVCTEAAVRILGLPGEARDDIGGFVDGLLADLPATSQRPAPLLLRGVGPGPPPLRLKTQRVPPPPPAPQ